MRVLGWVAGIGVLALGTVFGAESLPGVPRKAVRTRTFEISVDPADRNSDDARSADLFVTRFPGAGWRLVGTCKPSARPGGAKFSRVVSVPGDGVYYYRSRAGDAAGKAPEPTRVMQPEVAVVVDTTRPVVQLDSPLGSETWRAGDKATIRWSAQDRNFGPAPISVHYSEDGGRSWNPIVENAENDSQEDWTVPALQSGQVLLRVSAADVAGNVTQAMTSRAIRVLRPGEVDPRQRSRAPVLAEPPVGGPETRAGDVDWQDDPNSTAPSAASPDEDEIDAAWLEANNANIQNLPWSDYTTNYSAYVAWLMAGNLIRQGRLKDSLRYLKTAVTEDPEFDEAWNDGALVYKELGDYDKGLLANARALGIEPEIPLYLQTRGEIHQRRYHEKGVARLKTGGALLGFDDLSKAHDDVRTAVKYFGKAIEASEKRGGLPEAAGSFFRLGEIAYYANYDPLAARQYWRKVMTLHSPTPDLDNIIHDQGTNREKRAREIYQKFTHMRVTLECWQAWAQSYLDQLEAMERKGWIQAAPNSGDPGDWYSAPAPIRKRAEPEVRYESPEPPNSRFANKHYGSALKSEDYTQPTPVQDCPPPPREKQPIPSDDRGGNFKRWPLPWSSRRAENPARSEPHSSKWAGESYRNPDTRADSDYWDYERRR